MNYLILLLGLLCAHRIVTKKHHKNGTSGTKRNLASEHHNAESKSSSQYAAPKTSSFYVAPVKNSFYATPTIALKRNSPFIQPAANSPYLVPNKSFTGLYPYKSSPYKTWNGNLAFLRSNLQITFPEILNKSMKGVLGGIKKSRDIKNLLLEHYFTDDEKNSIWPKAIEETEKNLNLVFTRDEMFKMEKAVKAIYRRMLECDFLFTTVHSGKLSKSKKRNRRKLKAKCYLTLHEYVDSGIAEFQFPRAGVENQAKLLQMNLAYNVMSLLILQMTQQMAIVAHVTPVRAAIAILDISENLVESIKMYTKETIDGRIQAISQIQICEMEVIFWKEFETSCEVRMKRDVASAEGIGGTIDKSKKRYRARVFDNVVNKEICNVALDTNDTKDKDQVMFELVKTCGWIRDNYARRVKRQIAAFYMRRSVPVVKELSKLWNNDKNKLKELKDKLRTKYNNI